MLINLQQRQTLFRFLAVLLVLHTCFIAYAQGMQGGDEKVTINGKNIPLRDVFKSITRQTGLHFFYSPEVVNTQEKVTVDVKQQPVDNVLNTLLADKGLAWVYNDNAIAIRSKDQGEKKRVRRDSKDSLNHPVTVNITGKVTDASGNAIPGATVLVKGTEKGTNTEVDGTFTLPDVALNTVVLISSIGFETREIPVKGKSINARLNVVVNDLDETVVVAYGTTTKRMNTGNVSTVKGEEIAKQPVSNPLLALQGRVPGMQITPANGLPGSGITVRIRGQNSFSNGNDPLYIIDGVPYTSQLLPGIGAILGSSGSSNGNIIGNPLSYINPSDIESIDILKDADATAIYGSRAANGAVLITTKKGKVGQTKVDVNVYTGWGSITRKVNLLNTQQYLQVRQEAFKNDGALPNPDSNYDLFNSYTWDSTRYTDWQEVLIGGTARYSNVEASVSGGNATTQFLVGGRYRKETTVFPGNFSDQKASLHFNINNVSSNQRFRILLSGNYLFDNNQLLREDLTSLITLPPNAPPIYNADGSLNWAEQPSGTPTWNNPFAELSRKYKNKTNNLVSNASISYQLLSNLNIKSNVGYTNMQTNEVSLSPRASYSPTSTSQRNSIFAMNNIQSWIIEPQITYTVNIGKGRLEALVGSTIQQNNSSGQTFFTEGYNSDAVLEDMKSAARVEVTSTTVAQYEYNAVFGRLNYNYQDKYLLNLTARRDGSSRFGPDSKFHNFGAVGAGWIFSKEPFIEKHFPFLSFGKLRGSYGTTGSDQIGDYQFMDLYYPGDFNYQGSRSLVINNLFNPSLAWEETRKLEGAIELGFLKDRIYLSASYFYNRSSNQLAGYSLPSTTGFGNITANQDATIQNNGWEFLLNTVNINKKDLRWTSSFNLSIIRNKLVKYGEGMLGYDPRAIGQSLGTGFFYHFLGVDPVTGQYQFADYKGNPTLTPSDQTDRTVLIDPTPKFYGGFQNSLSYKGIQLDLSFQFVKQLRENNLFSRFPGGSATNLPVSVLDRWQKPGDVATIQRYNQDYSLYDAFDKAKQSDAAITDASFIRLNNLSLSYQLPNSLQQRAHLRGSRIYLQCQNLLTVTNYKGADPEAGGFTSLPPLRVITVGIQLTL